MKLLQNNPSELKHPVWRLLVQRYENSAGRAGTQLLSRCRMRVTRRITGVAGYAIRGGVLAFILLVNGAGATTAQQIDDTTTVPSCFAKLPSQNGAPAAADYLLSQGDQLTVLVYQREDLSGTHLVGDDGMISLPLLGRLPAASSTLGQLEKSVASTIEKETGRVEHVSIELSVRRPIYVVGLVNRPGAYAFIANMTVLHAVALGGGLYRPDERAGGLIGVSRESARIGLSTLQLKQVLATRARLQAELDTKTKLEPPQKLVALAGEDGAQELMARQLRIMDQRTKALEQQTSGLKKAAELAKTEVKSLKQRQKLIDEQIKLALQELKAINKLKKKGLVRRADLFAIQRIISGLRADLREVEARISRAQRNLLETQDRRQLLSINMQLTLEEEIDKAELDVASNESSINASQWIVSELTTAAHQDEQDAKPVTIDYRIVRTVDKRRYKLPANELTALCPGDIIRVQPATIP